MRLKFCTFKYMKKKLLFFNITCRFHKRGTKIKVIIISAYSMHFSIVKKHARSFSDLLILKYFRKHSTGFNKQDFY